MSIHNGLRGFSVMLVLAIASLNLYKVFAQCTPPLAETCEEASVLCSINDLNGYTCQNISTVPSPCSPICSQGGVGHNTSWWAFIGDTGKIQLTLKTGSCTANEGLQFGIWSDCKCREEIVCNSIPCIPSNAQSSIELRLNACKIYYLWVDGCNGDICDFTIKTSTQSTPFQESLPFINNEQSQIIHICKNACNVKFYVDKPGDVCPASKYLWTMDGNDLPVTDNSLRLDAPDQPEFELCVEAYIGDSNSNLICSKSPRQCARIVVDGKPQFHLRSRIICEEKAPKGLSRDQYCIYYLNGTYRCEYFDSVCCSTIDTGSIIILPVPNAPDVYGIDTLGSVPCIDHRIIKLPSSTELYRCDSSIILTTVNVKLEVNFKFNIIGCKNDSIEITPNVKVVNACSVGESYEFYYKWSKSFDGFPLSRDERCAVPFAHNTYNLALTAGVHLGDQYKLITYYYYVTVDTGKISIMDFHINAYSEICKNGISYYYLDSVDFKRVNHYNWTVTGGVIISNPDSQYIQVQWMLMDNQSGTVCADFDTYCGTSMTKCITLTPRLETAGKDFKQKGLIARMRAKTIHTGNWNIISGPGKVIFQNYLDPSTLVRVDQYGTYCLEWINNGPSCVPRDTICIEFYKIKTTVPDTPHKMLEDRIDEESDGMDYWDVYTPNLIPANGNSYLQFSESGNDAVHYTWYDTNGQKLLSHRIEAGYKDCKIFIESPQASGLYILVIESGDQKTVRKIVAMN